VCPPWGDWIEGQSPSGDAGRDGPREGDGFELAGGVAPQEAAAIG
jgi:hypothetical protein